jgi:hypothetical protein
MKNGYTLCPGADPSLCVTFPPLHGVYAAIHERAKNAHIFVLNYPVMFSSTAKKDCDVYTFGLYKVKAANQQFIAEQGARLNALVQSEVDIARANHLPVTLVDVATIFGGHELCGTLKKPWFNGLWLGTDITSVRLSKVIPFIPLPESFHPNQLGQDAMYTILKLYPGLSG